MRVNVPSSGGGLSAFLQAILHGAGVKPTGPVQDKNNYIRPETLAKVRTSLSELNQALTERERTAHSKKQATLTRSTGLAMLERTIRDLWSGLRRRVKREAMPVELLPLFGLTGDGRNPHHLKPWLWTDYARRIIEAEKTATAAGHEPMVNPGVDAVSGLLTQVVTAQETETRAAQTLLAQRKHTNELVESAYYLVLHVLAEIRLALRGRDAVYVRNVIRAYGGSFRGDPPTQVVDMPQNQEEAVAEASEAEPVVAAEPEPMAAAASPPNGEPRRKKRKRHRRRLRAAVKRARKKARKGAFASG